jgi:DNA processing protein
MALLEGHFGALSRAWKADEMELNGAGLDRGTARHIVTRRATIDPDRELENVISAGVKAITWHDDEYPMRLGEIYDKPPVLYVKGELPPDDERLVAVVGTRKPSAYGREVAYQLSFDLARAGVTITSGLARGIDGIAHRAALEADQQTVAVLRSGVDVIYPREHNSLAQQIIGNGALVSEHPMGTRPNAQNFPRRNRIISGMTLGTVVIEAPESSGALLTATHAIEQDREVFAVPGNIFSPNSKRVNRLIRDSSAKLVTSVEDILEELNLPTVTHQLEMAAFFPEDEAEAAVLKFVSFDPIHIDEITRNSALAASTVSSALTMMELKGLVKQTGGMNYMRLKETRTAYQVV